MDETMGHVAVVALRASGRLHPCRAAIPAAAAATRLPQTWRERASTHAIAFSFSLACSQDDDTVSTDNTRRNGADNGDCGCAGCVCRSCVCACRPFRCSHVRLQYRRTISRRRAAHVPLRRSRVHQRVRILHAAIHQREAGEGLSADEGGEGKERPLAAQIRRPQRAIVVCAIQLMLL